MNSASRRPLKSRGTAWAGRCSRAMLKMGLKPNTVSLLSIACAGLAGVSIWWAALEGHSKWFWLLAAVGVQLRLFCNLMDGLLAVEGGLKLRTGDLFNEIPDRIADALILVPFGYAGGTPLTIALGWAAACGAVFTAYLRVMGAALLQKHDFCGPMAKQQRMAVVTAGCLGMLLLGLMKFYFPLVFWTLVLINLGIVITSWRRISHLVSGLR